MFTKKDYLSYLKELYRVEIEMKKEITGIIKMLDDPRAIKIAEKIKADEIRHAGLVQEMMKLL